MKGELIAASLGKLLLTDCPTALILVGGFGTRLRPLVRHLKIHCHYTNARART